MWVFAAKGDPHQSKNYERNFVEKIIFLLLVANLEPPSSSSHQRHGAVDLQTLTVGRKDSIKNKNNTIVLQYEKRNRHAVELQLTLANSVLPTSATWTLQKFGIMLKEAMCNHLRQQASVKPKNNVDHLRSIQNSFTRKLMIFLDELLPCQSSEPVGSTSTIKFLSWRSNNF